MSSSPDEGHVHAQGAMHTSAGEAQVHAIRNGCPSRILRGAIKAHLHDERGTCPHWATM